MDSKYDQDDWRIILGEHVNGGCCVSETLRAVRAKFPRLAHLARKTFEEFLRSEDGRKQLDEELKAREEERRSALERNKEKWSGLSLYQLWEACSKELLINALAGDREATRQAVKYLHAKKEVREEPGVPDEGPVAALAVAGDESTPCAQPAEA